MLRMKFQIKHNIPKKRYELFCICSYLNIPIIPHPAKHFTVRNNIVNHLKLLVMALTFHPAKLTAQQVKEMIDTPGFNRIALQHYTTNGTDFGLVAQLLSPARSKIGPPVVFLTQVTGTTYSPSRDFVFGQYELTKVQLKRLSKEGTQDVTFQPKKGEINPESTDYGLSDGSDLHPSPPAPPPNP